RAVIAVVDRDGFVLGVWSLAGARSVKGMVIFPKAGVIAAAVARAGTAAFLSSDQNAFTSRTAGYIIQQHFPVGVRNTPPGPLVGVGLSNLFFSDINKFKKPGSLSVFNQQPGLSIMPIIGTSLDGTPGGVPLYKSGKLVG